MALHVLAALSVAAVFGAALRVASLATTGGLERVVAGATVGVAAVVAEALALGLLGLAKYPAAIAALAGLTWLLAWRLLPRSEVPALEQLASRWRALSGLARAVAGALAGAAAVWVLWPVHHPFVGYDGISYHMPEVLGWVWSGHPGAIHDVSYLVPFPNYPVTNEVALTWLTSVSRGFTAAAVWTPLLHLLLVTAGWLGLRALRVPRPHTALALAAVCLIPLTVEQVNSPSTDLAGLTWCVCTAALAATGARNPRLLPFALVAAGLAVGTKTSTVPLAVGAVAMALYVARGSLRPLARPLALGALVALAVGGVWYVRNVVDHGSPLYPVVKTPGGDQPPYVWRLLDHSLLDRPAATLRGRTQLYLDLLGGSLVLLVGAVVVPALVRVRSVLLAGGAAIIAILLWAKAPSTGVPDVPVLKPNVAGTTRYALPALAAVALVPAVAATAGRRAAWLSGAVLAAAVGWNLVRLTELGQSFVPPLRWVALAAAAGAAGSAVLRAVPLGGRLAGPPVVVAATAAGILLGQQAGGYVQRLSPSATLFPSASVVSWFDSQPGFQDDHRPIAIAGQLVSPLAGNRLTHRLTLVPQRESCAATRARAARAWVVVADDKLLQSLVRVPGIGCFAGIHPAYSTGSVSVYGGGGS